MNFSITRIGTLYILAALVSGAVLLGLATLVLNDARIVAKIWTDFEATRSEKALALASIRREMGFGGMIHNFKNFVLRGDTDLLHVVEERIGGAAAAIRLYRQQGVEVPEERALLVLEDTLHQYTDGIDLAREMAIQGASPADIDRAVSVNDSPALKALETLTNAASGSWEAEGHSRKPLLLDDLRKALGYGGFIHQFKNYILRRTPNDIPRIQATLRKIESILGEYSQLAATDAERAAVQSIGKVIESYGERLGGAAEMVRRNLEPAVIDFAVRIDDGPAITGLGTLTRIIVAEHQAATRELGSAVGRILQTITNQVWAVAALVVGMIAVTIWVLRFLIVNPLNRLAGSMLELANGNLEASIPDAGADTEIGRMAANMNVFKANEVERRAAEEQARERERWFQALLASAPDPTIIVDDQGTIQLANTQTEMVFGYTSEEMVGQKIEMLVPDNVKPHHVAHRTSYTDTALVRPMGAGLELFGQRKSGEVFPVEVSLSPIKTTMGTQIAAAVRDITKRKEAEEQLKQAFSVISGSIDYAANIQRSILPHEDSFSTVFDDYLVIWEPRDRVGGDVYWNRIWGDGILVILADCTGHGVPGAFMTLIASGALDRAQDEVEPGDVAKLIARMHQLIQLTLSQHTTSGTSDDGLELGAVYIDGEQASMKFVGARFSLFVCDGQETKEFKGDRNGIGYRGVPYAVEFSTRTVIIDPGHSYYLTTDGIIDQVGGPKSRSFGKKRLKALLPDIHGKSMDEQAEILARTLEDYQGSQPRRDDVSIIGLRIG